MKISKKILRQIIIGILSENVENVESEKVIKISNEIMDVIENNEFTK